MPVHLIEMLIDILGRQKKVMVVAPFLIPSYVWEHFVFKKS
jgi:hypothetical protein